MGKFRFDIVFFNYKNASCFTNNFSRIVNFDTEKDRIICVSASPLNVRKKEKNLLRDFCKRNNIMNFRYLVRKNFGLAEKGRLDYFSGKVGGKQNFNSTYIMQMQEHYLDLQAPCSKWGKEFNYAIKGDVSPNIIFDLDEIENFFKNLNLSTLYADRGNPMFFSIANKKFIAPNGGNFFLKTSILLQNNKKFWRLMSTCDNDYGWALFMEYYWGELFFREDFLTYDYTNRIFITNFEHYLDLFKTGKEDYFFLRNKYLSKKFYPEYCSKNVKDMLFSMYFRLPTNIKKVLKFFLSIFNVTNN